MGNQSTDLKDIATIETVKGKAFKDILPGRKLLTKTHMKSKLESHSPCQQALLSPYSRQRGKKNSLHLPLNASIKEN